MTTPLPPVLCHTQDMDEQYTADQLKDYGAAEFQRGIDAAAKVIEQDCHDDMTRAEEAAAIRKLGEAS